MAKRPPVRLARHRWGMTMAAAAPALLTLSLSAELAAGKPRHTLGAGKTLRPGQALVAGSARLAMLEDGDLGVYAPRSSGGARASSLEAELEALWRTGTETPEYVGSELAAGEQLGPNQ